MSKTVNRGRKGNLRMKKCERCGAEYLNATVIKVDGDIYVTGVVLEYEIMLYRAYAHFELCEECTRKIIDVIKGDRI